MTAAGDLYVALRSRRSHESPVSDTEIWLTPPDLLAKLGAFDLDPCAAPEPRPWPTAQTHYTREHNGLTKPWRGRVWLNPPYGAPATMRAWLGRMANHGEGTALIFARTETEVFHEFVWQAASAVLFLKGRLRFCRPNGTQAKVNAGAPSVLIAYGSQDANRLLASGIAGYFQQINGISLSSGQS